MKVRGVVLLQYSHIYNIGLPPVILKIIYSEVNEIAYFYDNVLAIYYPFTRKET
jgi:hypothetical protein